MFLVNAIQFRGCQDQRFSVYVLLEAWKTSLTAYYTYIQVVIYFGSLLSC